MEATQTAPPLLKGEGEVQFIKRTRVRLECEDCGEPATVKQTYLFVNCRQNPASTAYGRDDCTWCEDAAAFYCTACHAKHRWDCPDGHMRCSTFTKPEKWPHLFLEWREVKLAAAPAVAGIEE